MCNLHQATPKNDLEVFMGRYVRELFLPDYGASRPVGPFGAGMFVKATTAGLTGVVGQWGMIRPGQRERIDYMVSKAPPGRKPPAPRPRSTNNARIEGIESKPTFRDAWRASQRCLIPAAWYAEPNWETGKNIWWHLTRADGLPWMLAGLWSEWADPHTGELVPNFTMITCNCDGRPLLGRLHKPDPNLPADQQDKRSLIHVDPDCWDQWLRGTESDARVLIKPAPEGMFDHSDAVKIDALLAMGTPSGGLF